MTETLAVKYQVPENNGQVNNIGPGDETFIDIRRLSLLSEDENRRLSAQIISAQFSLITLEAISHSDLISHREQVLISSMLEDKSASFLLDQFNRHLKWFSNLSAKHPEKLNPENTAFVQEVIDYKKTISDNLEKLSQIANEQIRQTKRRGIIEGSLKNIAGGLESFENLVTNNRMIVLQRTFKHLRSALKLTRKDLISFGDEGLMIAAARFDGTRNVQFSTYAIYWIDACITRGISNTDCSIRVPCDVQKDARIKRNQQTEIGETPKDALWLQQSVISFDQIMSKNEEDDDKGFYKLVPDKSPSTEEIAEDEVFREQLRNKLSSFLNTIPPRNRMVLMMRFYGGFTLDEIAEILNVTRQRIQQIESSALKKLRENPEIMAELANFINDI